MGGPVESAPPATRQPRAAWPCRREVGLGGVAEKVADRPGRTRRGRAPARSGGRGRPPATVPEGRRPAGEREARASLSPPRGRETGRPRSLQPLLEVGDELSD